jgi:hypothetical protein
MWPIPIIIGLGALLYDAFSEDEEDEKEIKKLFISFSIKDKKYRDFLVAQSKNERTPFSFADMSVKKPWNQAEWKRKCREKIKSCDGVIVLLSKNTWHSSGARWEIKCAKEEGIKIIGMHIQKDNKGAIPTELQGTRVVEWSWENLEKFITKL